MFYFCLCRCCTSQVNSYGHGGTPSLPDHTFSSASLIKRLHVYFCLKLTTALLEWFRGGQEKDCRNYFMINRHERVWYVRGLSCKPNIYVSWSTSELRMRLAPLNWFKPSSKIFYWPFQGGTSFVDLLCFLFCLVFAMSLCASFYMCFVVTCWERADLLALVCIV